MAAGTLFESDIAAWYVITPWNSYLDVLLAQ